MTAFTPLTQQEKESHLNMFDTTGTSGILGSGEANYFDTNQLLNNDNTIDFTKNNVIYSGGLTNPPDENINISSISPSGLSFSQVLSNGKVSSEYSINDFSIFSNYIHYIPTSKPYIVNDTIVNKEYASFAFNINTSQFLNIATTFFNIYSLEYRN